MTAFVTGGSGFIGGALVERLVADGTAVMALARSDEAAGRLSALGAVPVPGDVFASVALHEAMSGCDVVYHVAGMNQMCPADAAPMYRVNVDGTRIVVAAAAAAGVHRVVVTSSAAAIGEAAGEIADEATRHSGEYLSHYARSKKLGEDAAFEEGERHGVEVVAVNPSSVQGVGRRGGSARLLRHAMRSSRPLVLASPVSIVDIADCTAGHLLAASRGRTGARYLLNGAVLPAPDLVRLIGTVMGRDIRPVVVPRWAASTVGVPIAAVVAAVRRGGLCPEMVRTLVHGHRIDGSLAERELGLAYTPLPDTLTRLVAWFRAEGLLPPLG